MKVLVRGGSIASGIGVKTGYVSILKDFCSTSGIEVVNCSRSGDTSFDGIWTFEKDIKPYAPDILLIHFGMDDAFFPVYRSEFKENLVRMVRSARECINPITVLSTSHTLDDPYEMEAVNIYYRAIREVCLDLDCEMVPVHTYWAGYLQDHGLSNAELVQKDCRLPNEHGHKVFAEVIIQRLKRIIP
jgi:hypothetical protein